MDTPRVVHGNAIPMGISWETSHGMRWDRHKLVWDENGTDEYVPWTTLVILTKFVGCADSDLLYISKLSPSYLASHTH